MKTCTYLLLSLGLLVSIVCCRNARTPEQEQHMAHDYPWQANKTSLEKNDERMALYDKAALHFANIVVREDANDTVRADALFTLRWISAYIRHDYEMALQYLNQYLEIVGPEHESYPTCMAYKVDDLWHYCNIEIDGPEDGVFRLSKDLSIGLVPSPCDSLRFLSLALSRTGEARMPLKRYPICKPDGTAEYSYTTRPFTINTFQLGEFIPLVLYGSFWWDNDAGCTRCCGESVIAPDFSSEILKYIPHYYIIGVEINK